MDIVGVIRSAPLVDLAIFAGFLGAFVLGAAQGVIRRVLGIISLIFAFLLATSLRAPVGDYLAGQWTHFPSGYDHLVAFIVLFAVLWIGFSILIQGFYKRTDLSAAHPVVDDVAGGLLGVLEALILLVIAIIILGSYALPDQLAGEYPQLRWAHDLLLQQSHIAQALRDHVAPTVVHLLSVLLPSDLVAMFP